ncbi:hypothetical protein [Paraburkholderia sp. J76]|uniref:hypothetical protein n=1 Tax=Paraburkholderia sp. J76 TaxID=2805439 RepID=UPI002ABE5A5E|nr:hypothetical protein [Paraburkholderia sp. J76]
MKTAFNRHRTVFVPTVLAFCLAFASPLPVSAAGRGGGAHAAREHAGGGPRGGGARGGGPQVNSARADARTRNVRNTSVNNVNVNRNVNVNANVDRHGGWDNDYHPVATAAAVTAAVGVTSAVVGSMVRSVPSNCVPVNYGGMVYQQCGSTWYQPQGSQYIVVNPPY